MSEHTVRLNNGVNMPAVGLGTWQGSMEKHGDNVKEEMLTAIKQGYRYIDTAWFYNSESAVGNAIKESGIPRSEFFITTKLWNTYHRRVEQGLEKSLELLGPGAEGYVDLYLMHWPVAWEYAGDERMPRTKAGELALDEGRSYVDTWKDMEKLDKKKARSIGISNFSIKTLNVLLPEVTITPAVNQVELTPWLQEIELKKFCNDKGIALTSYSPFGQKDLELLQEEILVDIAKTHKVAVNSIIISWLVQRGDTVCPKSGDIARQEENFTVIKLSDDDMKRIATMDKGKRSAEAEDPAMGWSHERLGWIPQSQLNA